MNHDSTASGLLIVASPTCGKTHAINVMRVASLHAHKERGFTNAIGDPILTDVDDISTMLKASFPGGLKDRPIKEFMLGMLTAGCLREPGIVFSNRWGRHFRIGLTGSDSVKLPIGFYRESATETFNILEARAASLGQRNRIRIEKVRDWIRSYEREAHSVFDRVIPLREGQWLSDMPVIQALTRLYCAQILAEGETAYRSLDHWLSEEVPVFMRRTTVRQAKEN